MAQKAGTNTKVVIFDLDGTLIGDAGPIAWVRKKGMEYSYEEAIQRSNERFRSKPTFGGWSFLEKLCRYFSDQSPKAGAVELLTQLKDNHIPVFIITVGNQDNARKLVRETFGDLVDQDKIYGSGTGKAVKPDPRAYTAPLKEHGIPLESPEQIVVVGDTVHNDLISAVRLGMRAVYVNNHPEEDRELLDRFVRDGKIAEVRSLREIQPLVQKTSAIHKAAQQPGQEKSKAVELDIAAKAPAASFLERYLAEPNTAGRAV